MKLLGAVERVRWSKVLSCLKQVRFLHVMHNDKWSRPYIELIRSHFNGSGHVFVFFGGYPESQFGIPDNDNVLLLRSRSQFYLLGLLIRRAGQIFFHGLFSEPVIDYAYRHRSRLSKASWIIWGGDLYPDKENRNPGIFPRKQALVQSLGSLIVVAPGDFAIARELYGFQGPGYYGLYSLPVSKPLLDRYAFAGNRSSTPLIQLNNCSDKSILDGLQQLARFQGMPFTLRTILSYGNTAIRERIQTLGQELFGDKFVAITQFMPPEHYARLIGQAQVLIMNQPRQQGLGNIYAFLYTGAKVYLRHDVTSWQFLKEKGFKIFDALELEKETWESLLHYEQEEQRRNCQLAGELLEESQVVRSWGDIFAGRAPAISAA